MLIDKYNRIDVNKLPTEVRRELAEIAHDTDGFKDEDLNKIYEENFNTLYKLIEEKYPDAIRAKKKLTKKIKVKLLKKKGDKKLLRKTHDFQRGDAVEINKPGHHYHEKQGDVSDTLPNNRIEVRFYTTDGGYDDEMFDASELKRIKGEPEKISSGGKKRLVKKEEIAPTWLKYSDQLIAAGFSDGDIAIILFGLPVKTEGEMEGETTRGITRYRPEAIQGHIDEVIADKKKGWFQAGFKYWSFDKKKFFAKHNIVDNTIPAKIKISEDRDLKFDAYVTKSGKTVLSFSEGQTGKGGYAGLFSLDEKEGLAIVKDALADGISTYIKDVDIFYNGKGGIDQEEALRILNANKPEKKKLIKKADVSSVASSTEGLPKVEAKEGKLTCSTALQRIHDEVMERFEQDSEGKKIDWKTFLGKIADYVDHAKADLAAQHKAAADARANAPKKKVSTLVKERQMHILQTAFKTKQLKGDHLRAVQLSADISAAYRKHGLTDIADHIADQAPKMIDKHYGKAAKGAQLREDKLRTLIDVLTDISIDMEGENETIVAGFRLELEDVNGDVEKAQHHINEFKEYWLEDISDIKAKEAIRKAIEEYESGTADKGTQLGSDRFGLTGNDLWYGGTYPKAELIIGVKELAKDNIRVITQPYGTSTTTDRSFTENEIKALLEGKIVKGKYELYKRKAAKGAQLSADSKSHMDALYQKRQSIDLAMQDYAGELGIFNLYYGHKVDAEKKKKWNDAYSYLSGKYARAAQGAQLYTGDELIHKYSGKYIDVYPHHHTKWNDKLGRYETVYEVRGVSRKIRENYNLPEDAIAKRGVQLKKCDVGTEIQTLIFSKDKFTEAEAKHWASAHFFRKGVDEKPDSYRMRQEEPSEFKPDSFRTIELTDGIKAVIGCPLHKAERGAIVNQYEGKTAKQVWDDWSEPQRLHFIIDHTGSQHTPASQHEISKKAYNFIPADVKHELEKHISMGQYARGGRLPQFIEGEKVNVNDTGYVKYFSGFDTSRPATVLSSQKTKNGWFYKLKMADGSIPFNNAFESMLSKTE